MSVIEVSLSPGRGIRAIGRLSLRGHIDPLLFAGVFVVYAAIGAYLSLVRHFVVPDALSRVANAYYVLFSRDPHLAAIGFVWNPLPSILEMPLVAAGRVWQPLVDTAYVAVIVTAAAMAGAVVVLRRLLADLGVARPAAAALLLLFAAYPMIVQFATNGDSEALYILLLLLATRSLASWLHDRSAGSLVGCALALALGYMTRYEVIAAGAAVTLVVIAVSASDARGSWRHRLAAGGADGVLVAAPIGFAFVAWAFASWVIVGDPFEQFTSVYGTSSQLATDPTILAGVRAGGGLAPFIAHQALGLAPAAPVLLGLAAVAAVRARDLRILAPLAIVGGVLAFALLAALMGQTSDWLRYFVTVIPFSVLMAAVALERTRLQPAGRMAARPIGAGRFAAFARVQDAWERAVDRLRGLPAPGARAALLVLALVATGIPVSIATMADRIVGRGQDEMLQGQSAYPVAAEVASYLDAQRLPPGSVLIDTFEGFTTVLHSTDPRQFVITSDRDFDAVVADPQAFRVRFVLVPPDSGLGGLDAINRRHPGFYENGAGIAHLVRQFGDGATAWRLYEIDA